MGKPQRENWRVKAQLIRALLGLMEEKPLAEIHVTDITRRAKVSRQAYYRNFTGKQGILDAFYDAIHREILFRLAAQLETFDEESLLRQILEVLQGHRRAVLTLCRAGLSVPILEAINQHIELAAGDMPAGSPERYRLYAFAGAVYHVAVTWLKEGAKEPAEVVAHVLRGFYGEERAFLDGQRELVLEELQRFSDEGPCLLEREEPNEEEETRHE